MSLQHADFSVDNSVFIGSPDLARLLSEAVHAVASAENGPEYNGQELSASAAAAGFVNPAPVDPARVPSGLRHSVRVLASTERRVARLAADLGLTFWGEAVSLILGLVAANPGRFDGRRLRASAPAGLLRTRGALRRGHVLPPAPVRRIQSPVTPRTAEFLRAIADLERVSPAAAAALIIHRHAAQVAAILSAR